MAKTTDQIVLEVFNGKWGSGDARKQKLTAAGYNYDVIQKRINEVSAHMKSRKEAMKPWFDACKAQYNWSYNAKYNWGDWDKTIASSKYYGTCITFPNVVAMRCGLIKERYKYIASTGSDNDSKATQNSFYNNAVKAMNSINGKYWSSIKYPEKTTAQLVREGKIKEGDIIGFMGHTASYAYKDSKGNLLFNHAGHAAGIYNDNKPGSNRAVLNVKSSSMSNRKVYGVFSVNTFIVLTSCKNGAITYSNRHMAGQKVTITIIPNAGMEVKSIKVDGKAVNPTTSYVINKIDSHHIVEVVCGKAAQKTIDAIAKEVIAGKWGSGDERKKKLTAAGYDYNAVQKRVNELLASKKKSVDVIAQEVINGKWGSGDARKKKLIAAGYNYDAVQKKVNELLAKKAPVKKTYSGILPTTTVRKSNAQVINDTIKWAKWIAGDNRFHYGYTNKAKDANAHHNGCYFCGTNKNQKRNMLDPKFTYCCNPFVGAAWGHGGCVPKALSLCRNTSSWGFGKNTGYATSSLFTNLGHPAKASLKPGDVLCKDTHVALYIGGGKIAEAATGDDNIRNSTKWNNSIRVTTLTDARYKEFLRVHRYNSSVNAIVTMSYGEVGYRVELWQKYLNWYFGKTVVTVDGLYGDATLKYTKQFQEKEVGKGQGDGWVGPRTLAAAAIVKK